VKLFKESSGMCAHDGERACAPTHIDYHVFSSGELNIRAALRPVAETCRALLQVLWFSLGARGKFGSFPYQLGSGTDGAKS